MPIGAGIFSRVGRRLPGAAASSLWAAGRGAGAGAMVGAGVGAGWGMLSGDTSVIGGAMMGAAMGAGIGRYGGRGYRAFAGARDWGMKGGAALGTAAMGSLKFMRRDVMRGIGGPRGGGGIRGAYRGARSWWGGGNTTVASNSAGAAAAKQQQAVAAAANIGPTTAANAAVNPVASSMGGSPGASATMDAARNFWGGVGSTARRNAPEATRAQQLADIARRTPAEYKGPLTRMNERGARGVTGGFIAPF